MILEYCFHFYLIKKRYVIETLKCSHNTPFSFCYKFRIGTVESYMLKNIKKDTYSYFILETQPIFRFTSFELGNQTNIVG